MDEDARGAGNIAIVQEMMDGLGQQDVVDRLLAEDVVIEVPEGLPYGGTRHGRDGYMSIVGDLLACWSDIAFGPHNLAAIGDRVINVSRLKGTLAATGRKIDEPFCELWQLRDGQVTRITPFYFDTKGVADG